MIIFARNKRPLSAKLMFKWMLLSAFIGTVFPQILSAIDYRFVGLPTPLFDYTCAICVVLGVLGYIFACIGLVLSLTLRGPNDD